MRKHGENTRMRKHGENTRMRKHGEETRRIARMRNQEDNPDEETRISNRMRKPG